MTTTQKIEPNFDYSAENVSVLATTLRAFVLPAAVCVAGVAMFWSLPAKAQSFSCGQASTAAEFTICNNETLITLDEKLGEKFADKFIKASTSPQRQVVARAQTEWVKKRNSCENDVPCLVLRYNERLAQLDTRAS